MNVQLQAGEFDYLVGRKILRRGLEGTRMETNRVSMTERPQGPRVVIIGGGFGGLHAA